MKVVTAVIACVVLILPACSDSSTRGVTGVPMAAFAVVKPGDDIQAAVDSSPPGTTFRLAAGTYRQQRIVPKSGDQFIGDPGTIFDGEHVAVYAFTVGYDSTSSPSDVQIRGLVIQNYTPPAQQGAVHIGGVTREANGHGWVVEDCEIRYNAALGVDIGDATRLVGNHIHHNGELGVGGLGDSARIDSNEVAWNNYQSKYNFGFAAGGVKLAISRGSRLTRNYVHDNVGPGLWCDNDCYDTLIEGNRAEHNADTGIFYEISYRGIIRDNTAKGNGFANAKWLYGAGIVISSSRNVEVYGNTVTNNARGITGVMQDRGSGRYGPHVLENLYVHDNTVTMRAGAIDEFTGIGQDIGDKSYFMRHGNRFANNTYYLGTAALYFAWMDVDLTEAGWVRNGQDARGKFYR
jgi:parallel beta-helix repeat protein